MYFYTLQIVAQSVPVKPNPVSLVLQNLLAQAEAKKIDVAESTGMKRSTVSRITSPFYPNHTIESLERIGEALGYDLHVEFTPKSRD